MQVVKSEIKIYKIIMTIITALLICFIWGNSLLPGEDSGVLSKKALEIANSMFKNAEISEFMVRKAAHFTEHMFLGVSLLIMLRSYTTQILKNICNVLFVGLFVPVIDEFIQLFVDGRGGEIRDVIIDFSGLLTGIIITLIIIMMVDKFKNNKSLMRGSSNYVRYKNYKK